MRKWTRKVVGMVLGACVLLGPGTPWAAGLDGTVLRPKQLAGPPEEFEAMREPDPAQAAILSRSALLPVVLDGAGRATLRLPAHTGTLEAMLLPGGADWAPRLVSPTGRALPAAEFARAAAPSRLGGEHDGHAGTVIRLRDLAPGDWTLQLSGAPGARGHVLLRGGPGLELVSHQAHRRQRVGEPMTLRAMLAADDGASATRLGVEAGTIDSAQLRLLAPDGRERWLPMSGAGSDGLLAGRFVPDAAGTWVAQVVVHGRDARGQGFVRTAEHVIPVLAPGLRLEAAAATATPAGVGRLQVALPVAAAREGAHVRVLAEVWGRDARGMEVPVAWIGGMTPVAGGHLALGLDERWIARAGARAPFELRALRIEDPDHFIPLATAARLPLALPSQRGRATATTATTAAAAGPVDETMRMGPRPARMEMAAAATGSKLLLVHGYCSAGVWPQSQFANAATFLDAHQNRSHDQFALRLRDFGAQWNSFGTVAHSQGGAAALHLYSYYWSGLDNAGAGRLMQSVGTPYQGTNLAGIIATIGNWFGVACGSNSNMTYSGAQAWLAGIPAWARAKVNYYTTAFRSTNWWTNDYCHAASDLVLSDPEDGTVERDYAQLPGATNRGHVTGQCHTAGMRDPAQYQDAARNATMSANAAR